MGSNIHDLRHAVYVETLCALPPASVDQARIFMANLRLPQDSLSKFLLLRVSPGMGQTAHLTERPQDLLKRLDKLFGADIERIAGFYRDGRGTLCWTIPDGCALYPYRSQTGFFNGILCQPLSMIDKFWLISSSKYLGPKAIRLSNKDTALFEAGIYQREAVARV